MTSRNITLNNGHDVIVHETAHGLCVELEGGLLFDAEEERFVPACDGMDMSAPLNDARNAIAIYYDEVIDEVMDDECDDDECDDDKYHGFCDNGRHPSDHDYVATATYRDLNVVFERGTDEDDVSQWLVTAYRGTIVWKTVDYYGDMTLAEVADDFADSIDVA